MKTKACNRFNALMADSLYDELRERDRGFFQAHLENCPACADQYEELSGVLKTMDKREQPEMSEAYWDNYLPQLQKKIGQMESESWLNKWNEWWGNFRFNINVRWLLYPAAALLLIVSGIVIGRFLYSPEGRQLLEDPASLVRKTNVGVTEHFENLRPVLTDYSNYSAQETAAGSGDMLWVDRETLQRLVIRNYLLKKAVARSNNASLISLMEDLEMILLEISNSGSGANRDETARMVQDMLKDNDVLFKMKAHRKKDRKRLSPTI